MTRQTWRWIGVAGWLLALGVSTTGRCHVWSSDFALWTDAVAKTPDKPRPTMNLGRAYELRGDRQAAAGAYFRAITLSYDDRRAKYVQRFTKAAAETNLAHLAMLDGRLASAMRILDATTADWPEFPYAHYNRGAIYWVYGACDEARAEYAKAMAFDPTLTAPKGPCAPSSTP